jgi:Cu+-exporting ATPase
MEESWGMVEYGDPSEPPMRSLDPVCGFAVNETNAAGKISYAGQDFYFCSVDCKEKFQAHPGHYIGQQSA